MGRLGKDIRKAWPHGLGNGPHGLGNGPHGLVIAIYCYCYIYNIHNFSATDV